MAFDRENSDPVKNTRKDSFSSFNLDVIDLIPSAKDRKGLTEMYRQEMAEFESGKLKQRMNEVLGKEIAPFKINQLFQFPERGIDSQTLMCTGDRSHFLETSTIMYTGQRAEAKLAGITNLAFVKGAELFLLVRHRDLEATGEQLGIEIQCRLEKFCRNNGIWKIRNVARSTPENYLDQGNRREIGGYVWARCGFEFESSADALGVLHKFSEYKVKNKIEPEKKFIGFGRAVDYAKIMGKDRKGNIVPLGKDFLTNSNVEWEGVRDLRLDSPGTKDFIEYLTEKGRTDLVEKYFTS